VRTSSNRLLLQLKGHLSAITDLQYSHAGDRIMTASQRDGVVRIWSWDVDPAVPDAYLQNNDRGLRHIVIKLTNPITSSNDSRKTRRRAPSATSVEVSKIACDVAAWSHDDSKIITSQSQPLRQSDAHIHPDSHFLFLWDSQTGRCLLGIAGAHTMMCPVIVPHPTDASVFCSAAADGYVKVWDWESGKCLFSHKNSLEHGPMDPNDRGKICGFLDGAFFPDGTGIVLTDDSGRVSVFDSINISSQQKQQSSNAITNAPGSAAVPCSPQCPFWMKEQYFANDYYDLSYDTNGYCVERGSQQPPHLAPGRVRCTHLMNPYPDNISEAFRKLVGPQPNTVRDCQWLRESIRYRAQLIHGGKTTRTGPHHRRGNIMQEFDPLTTILLTGSGEIVKTKNDRGQLVVPAPLTIASPAAQRQAIAVAPAAASQASPAEPRVSAYSGRPLSSNYRWRDYTDMLQEERHYDGEEDDDDEFQPTGNSRASALRLNGDSDDSDDDLDAFNRQFSPQQLRSQGRQPTRRNTSSSQAATELRASRASRRRRPAGSRRYDESDSDDDVIEYVSTNNEPTGPFKEDYTTHFFRLVTGGPPIARQWLRRLEYDSGFQGRRNYAPQVGDSVVYIPRAHFETIQVFPTLKAPWQHWPANTNWPVVRCLVRDIRYRFPYMDYFGGRNRTGSVHVNLESSVSCNESVSLFSNNFCLLLQEQLQQCCCNFDVGGDGNPRSFARTPF
jgi:hypothetical protein